MKTKFLFTLILTSIAHAEMPSPPIHQETTHLDMKEYNKKIEQEWASRLRKSGYDEISVFGFLEEKDQKDGLILIAESLEKWCAVYAGKQFNNTNITFNLNEKIQQGFKPDFTTPQSALASYLIAKQRSNFDFIQNNSDASFSGTLNRLMKSKDSKSDFINITILLEGSYICEGKEYIALYYRSDTNGDQKTRRISYRRDFFVFMNSQYYLTDAPRSSDFGNVYKLIGMKPHMKFGKYSNILSMLAKEKRIPLYFYKTRKLTQQGD